MEMCYVSKGIHNYIQVSNSHDFMVKCSPLHYRYKMLENNHIEGLIAPVAIEVDGELTLKYSTSSCYVLDRLFLRLKPDGHFLRNVIEQLEALLRRLRDYLLDPDDLVLAPEYMFYNWSERSIRLIYIPGYGQNLRLQLKKLLEYVMKIFDHRDEDGVRYMYSIYDLISEDTFSIDDLGREIDGTCLESPREKQIDDVAEKNNSSFVAEESTGGITSVEKAITKLVPLTSGALNEIILSKYDEMILVGRGKRENDYRIPTTQISRVHACIYMRGNGVYIEDRESTNGTYINSTRLEPLKQEQIKVGDLINFANEEFFVV